MEDYAICMHARCADHVDTDAYTQPAGNMKTGDMTATGISVRMRSGRATHMQRKRQQQVQQKLPEQEQLQEEHQLR